MAQMTIAVRTVGAERIVPLFRAAAHFNRSRLLSLDASELIESIQIPSQEPGVLWLRIDPSPLLMTLAQCPN